MLIIFKIEGEIKIIDRVTAEIRTVLPLERYYGLGLWSHYLVVNNLGGWGDSLILCDLRVGGHVDAAGHVCPEEGCPDPPDGGPDGGTDAGVDAGKKKP